MCAKKSQLESNLVVFFCFFNR